MELSCLIGSAVRKTRRCNTTGLNTGLPLAVSLMELILGLLVGCPSDPDVGFSDLGLKDPRLAVPFDVVDRLLPGQIRQLGSQVTYVTACRSIWATAEDCAICGGEYVALGRADYGTALRVWMAAA